jgi:hypothetical protein
MSRLSPSVLVIILLVSTLFIYLGPANTDWFVGIILVIIVLIGLFLSIMGSTPQQKEASRKMLGTMTGIVAVASAALLGQYALNNRIGLICAPVLLAAGYMSFLAILSRSGLNVEEGEVLLIQRRMDHQHVLRPPGLHSPMVPALEAGVAVMPTYNIQTDIEVDTVDTTYLHKVDKIIVDTTCRIIQHFPQDGEAIPVELRYEGFLKLPYNYPNRDHIFKELSDKRNKPISESRMSADFWIEAIQRQIGHDVDEELRTIIHDSTFYNPEKRTYGKLGPADISSRRSEVSVILKQRLQEKVQHWGIEMLEVGITQVILSPDRIKAFYYETASNREMQEAERSAKKEALRTRELADAVAYERQKLAETDLQIQRQRNAIENESTLAMIQNWLDAMISDNPEMKEEDLKHLLMVALDEHEKRKSYRDRPNLMHSSDQD